jgi:tetratricopeptide (TPR) repeat protein
MRESTFHGKFRYTCDSLCYTDFMSKTKLDAWCDALIEAGWLGALVVAPMFFNVFSSRVFEPDKISLVRSIALIMLLAWLVKLANGGPAWLPPSVKANGESAGDASARSLWRNPFAIPLLLLVAAYLISTLFSVATFVSWFGSYQRLQGTYSFLSYVIIALLTAAHLRQPEQFRRLQHVIIATSLPIAIYGIIQHMRQDPLPWGGDVTLRIAANAGNAIFLAAYLLMAFFFTLERVYNSFAHFLGGAGEPGQPEDTSQDLPAAASGGAYLFILMVQALAIFWTQSRGPWLGVLAGFYVFVLLWLSGLRPKHYKALMGAWVGLAALGAILLIVMNTTDVFAFLRPIPYVGRLTQLLDRESTTAQVRLFIWQGAADMLTPHQALTYPDGRQDAINAIRPLVGYGPEAMWVAYNPFYPPELAHVEARNASPDRSHNETWDSLVITGLFGFVGYMSLFISIFYWALRWLGLLVNRRDNLLFFGLLLGSSLAWILGLIISDGGHIRFFGAALPAGIITGLVLYTGTATFLHAGFSISREDIPRQLLIITILSTIVAHFAEIHFGIAIAATRTYFWVQTAMLLVLGMRWGQPEAFVWGLRQLGQEEVESEPLPPEPEEVKESAKGKRRRAAASTRPPAARRTRLDLPALPSMVMTDLLIFLTFVFIYTTNAQGSLSGLDVLFSSITQRMVGGQPVGSPAIFLLMLFTWLVTATLGLTAEALRHRRAPDLGWWLRGYGLHAAVVWGGWLFYGMVQGGRLAVGASGTTLDEQLNHIASHFAVYTTVLIFWLVTAATVYAWSTLRSRTLPAATRPAISLAAGALIAVAVFWVIGSVNVALVRADIIYKQGQQFDNQRNWISSIELYRRALDARATEDYYMLFLGRSLLEQAKQVRDQVQQGQPEGQFKLSPNPDIHEVLDLTPDRTSQMGWMELMRAAEVVLKEAQRINPLNTDHTANLARLYRSWSDLAYDDPVLRQEMLDRSVDQYSKAVKLSPNAAHLWNEKGNTHLARGERGEAETAYRHSLELDPLFEQTYLLMAEFLNDENRDAETVEILRHGIALMEADPRFSPSAAMYNYLAVALARIGDTEEAIDATLQVLEWQPNNVGAMLNVALLYRDSNRPAEGIPWIEKAISLTPVERPNEVAPLYEVAGQLYQSVGEVDKAIGVLEQLRQLAPNDVQTLRNLSNLYNLVGNDAKVLEMAQALIGLEPNNFEHQLSAAQALQRMGQEVDALTYANHALALAPMTDTLVISQFIQTLNDD